MEEIIKIKGKSKIKGSVRIGGAKNATVALIPAIVLANEKVRVFGAPNISDVDALCELLKELNCEIEMNDYSDITIDPSKMINIDLTHPSVTKLRASYYFMGALLGKYKEVKILMSGGCNLGPRPIDLHLKGFEALGAVVEDSHGVYHIHANELIGNSIFLDFASVGATINIMMAAVYAKGRTTIENAAKEPEIIDVANMLNKMGAQIRGAGTNEITIDGVDYLGGCIHEIIPDRIEAGTYIILGATAAEELLVENVIPLHIESLLLKLKEMNVDIEIGNDWVKVRKGNKLSPIDVKTLTYPGLATDLQQPLSVLLTQVEGTSKIRETIYLERFKHCYELNKMGAKIEVNNGMSLITGATELSGCSVVATDLRGGAAMVIAALIADGVTSISQVYHIDRGYDGIDEKLKSLGVEITRETI